MLRPVSSLLVLVYALFSPAGCGRPQPCPDADRSFACVDGATLALDAPPRCEYPLAGSAGLEAQTAKALELAGRLWGVDPEAYVTGWVIEFCQGWFVCSGGGTATWTWGCARLDENVISAAPGPTRCAAGVLIHELGHLVVGDLAHADPRFATASDMAGQPCESGPSV